MRSFVACFRKGKPFQRLRNERHKWRFENLFSNFTSRDGFENFGISVVSRAGVGTELVGRGDDRHFLAKRVIHIHKGTNI